MLWSGPAGEWGRGGLKLGGFGSWKSEDEALRSCRRGELGRQAGNKGPKCHGVSTNCHDNGKGWVLQSHSHQTYSVMSANSSASMIERSLSSPTEVVTCFAQLHRLGLTR